jgi:hypothetical protein
VATLSTSDDNSDQSNSEINSTDTNERSTRWRFGSSSDESKSAAEEQLDSLEKRLQKKDVIYSKLGSVTMIYNFEMYTLIVQYKTIQKLNKI